MSQTIKLLLVEDSVNDSLLLLNHLKNGGVVPEWERVETKAAMEAALENKQWDAVICDYNLPQFSAVDALKVLQEKKSDAPCIIVSGSIGEEIAVKMLRAGAKDYILKNNLTRLIPALERELREFEGRQRRAEMEIELSKREEELRQAQKLEAIGQLAGGIAHDFNNILAIILMQADVLIEIMNDKKNEPTLLDTVSKGIEQIKKSATRATNLTRQLLAFSRKQLVQPKVLKLNDLVLDMEKMLRRIIEESIDFKLSLAEDLKNICTDPGHLEQILVNIVVNSRDAMPSGGTLSIETKNSEIEVGLAQRCNVTPGPYVLLTIQDTGSGMTEEIKKHMFDPFFTTKGVGKGTGLGLSTVYGIVKQNKGLIFVDSLPGMGTTFRIYFPAAQEEIPEVVEKPSELLTVKGTETVLIVDDEKELRELALDGLKSNGYNVFQAGNGQEAIELIKSKKIKVDILLTDVVMPKMGGVELAKQVLDLDSNIRILFLSGYTEDVLIQQGLKTGLIHFMEKPYSVKDLLNKVRRILN